MLVLLPPSEGKTAPARGGPVDLARLAAPALAPARERVLDALAAVSAAPQGPSVLGVGPSLAPEVGRNTVLRTAPAAPAARVYTGVLHTAAGLAGLTGPARARAGRSVRILSGLWGVLAPADRIPAYRLSMGVALPGTGPLATYWREHLPAVLDEQADGDVVVDCRSATYAAAWRPGAAAQHVAVQVVRESGGRRQVVSHNAKHARGVLTRHLLVRPGRPPRTADQLAHAATELTGTAWGAVELTGTGRRRTLTLVEKD
ncbi:peroxide stress protein YaaA [Georgenia sp. M64]|uniref:YaaA family protein n=1 Tax=Georgenia sp. M64 TaxID=3120520 RepID=UPI0030E4A66C